MLKKNKKSKMIQLKFKNLLIASLLITFSLLNSSCSTFKKEEKKEGEVIIKKKQEPVNMKDRIVERETSGIWSSSKSRKSGGTTYEFATANALWRASLETLDFIPLTSVNYSGGIIVTDWYSGKTNSNESIKIEVRFLNNDIKSSSLKVNSFKRICKNQNCSITKNNNDFSLKIKDNIMQKARSLKIQEELQKKK